MKLNRFSIGTVLSLSVLFIFACASAESQGTNSADGTPEAASPSISSDSRVVVRGVVRRVGSDPFPRTIVTEDDGTDWYIQSSDVSKFAGYENQRVEVSGIPVERVMELANGTTIGTRRELKDVQIASSSSHSP